MAAERTLPVRQTAACPPSVLLYSHSSFRRSCLLPRCNGTVCPVLLLYTYAACLQRGGVLGVVRSAQDQYHHLFCCLHHHRTDDSLGRNDLLCLPGNAVL